MEYACKVIQTDYVAQEVIAGDLVFVLEVVVDEGAMVKQVAVGCSQG